MFFRMKICTVLLGSLIAIAIVGHMQSASAKGVTHEVSGIVKKVDKDAKTMVVKAADGTEHTIKYTDNTAMEGARDAAGDIKEGAHVSVRYTEEGGEKTAVGVKDVGKDIKREADKM